MAHQSSPPQCEDVPLEEAREVDASSRSELILSVAQLDYIADSDLDYVRIRASLD
jgi:hypothetical protein